MRHTLGILTICLLAGCAGSPPKPPYYKGDYRPINKPVSPNVFDFKFEGDIVDALDALRAIQPQLNVLPPVGTVAPLPVRVALRATTLKNALRALGEQGGESADVVWNITLQGSDQVFIRFRTPYQQPNAFFTPPAGK